MNFGFFRFMQVFLDLFKLVYILLVLISMVFYTLYLFNYIKKPRSGISVKNLSRYFHVHYRLFFKDLFWCIFVANAHFKILSIFSTTIIILHALFVRLYHDFFFFFFDSFSYFFYFFVIFNLFFRLSLNIGSFFSTLNMSPILQMAISVYKGFCQ